MLVPIMSDGISIDVGSAVPFLVDGLLSVFGKDAVSVEWREKLHRLVKLSVEQASFVQCVGMVKPVPIADIYQPTALIRPDLENRATSIDNLVKEGEDAIIFAGPGRGKTTLLHWMYMLFSRSIESTPLLFTLRWPDAPADLADFVDHLSKGASVKHKKGGKLVILVDGYDEISEKDRQIVSQSLMLFRGLNMGRFYLTCRTFYQIYDLKALHCEVAPFSHKDASEFIKAFANAYGAELQPESLLAELEAHGFNDFASHPLMLALVCILKTGPNRDIPRRAIGLIRRAIETLTFRWDEAKAIRRHSTIALDGEERLRCLMRIAYDMPLRAPWERVDKSLADHVRLAQLKGVNRRALLEELAQWYGILVPVDADGWQFVHRTIHDYLGARFWVESGEFTTKPVKEWNVRAAYAMSLLPNATQPIVRMLTEAPDIHAFSECLYNGALFDAGTVARAIVSRLITLADAQVDYTPNRVSVTSKSDFYANAGNEFLTDLVTWSAKVGGKAGDCVSFYVLSELFARKMRLGAGSLIHHMQALYSSNPNLEVQVYRNGKVVSFRLSDVVERR
jgi:hypothetical protein